MSEETALSEPRIEAGLENTLVNEIVASTLESEEEPKTKQVSVRTGGVEYKLRVPEDMYVHELTAAVGAERVRRRVNMPRFIQIGAKIDPQTKKEIPLFKSVPEVYVGPWLTSGRISNKDCYELDKRDGAKLDAFVQRYS